MFSNGIAHIGAFLSVGCRRAGAWCLLVVCLLGVVAYPRPLLAEEGIVKAIKVQGNRRVDTSTILYYIKTEVGKPLNPILIRKDIEQIYSLGQFSDIQVETREVEGGLEVIYVVEEIPSIGDVTFVGNFNLDTQDLSQVIAIKRGATFSEHLIQDSVEKLKNFYREKGYFLAQVDISTQPTADRLVNVTIRIREGEKVKIEEIRFRGNKSIEEDDLKDQMETEERTLFTWLDDSGIYKRDALKLDVLRLEAYYQDHGFLRVRVHDPEIEVNRREKEIYINITIEEGAQYRVGKVEVQGDDIYSAAEILKAMKIKPGDIYNVSQLREDILNITELYSQKGFAYADVNPRTKIDDKRHIVDLAVDIDKGRKVYVGQININGNIKTLDNVIRREFRLKEGELFDSRKLKRTKQRINNLGFFQDVKIDTRRGKESDQIDIDTTVTERPTGSITFGVGFSSVEKVIFNAAISQDNLFGRGHRVNLSTDLSSRRTNFNLEFTEPRLLDSEVSLGLDAFNRRSNFFSFDSESRGGGLRLGKYLSETDWLGFTYRFARVKISDVDPADVTPLLKNETRTTSRVGPTFIRDTRDNFINPSKGWRHVLRFEIAGNILGGSDFYKAGYEVSYYHPIIGKLVGAIHAEINYAEGYNGEDLPVFEHYFMGGASSLRGFTIRQVGPLTSSGEPLGGEQSLLLNVELQYPLTKEFRLFAFYDRGNVYGPGDNLSTTARNIDITKMRESIGAGLRFFSPFGPIAIAYGIKLDQQPGESSGEFHFSAGNAF